ncbi:MAG: GNAT family N-acetyltransferase [Imperialibacter sp.]|uniref:GNAT family N-acetyltransferase n=1 Tax=Imperialibacter sp. TaxID=2038411 RepID=UPI0032EF2419
MKIVNTQLADLDLVYHLFEESIRYQEAKGYPVWRNYDKGAIIRDIEQGNQYKVVAGDDVLIVFSVAYTDKVIWRAMDQGDAVYLHRIVVNPAFKGQRLFGHVMDWAKSHARQKGLPYVRMDTWAANANIVSYYQRFGFAFVENYTTPDTDELPVHNRELALTLLQYRI